MTKVFIFLSENDGDQHLFFFSAELVRDDNTRENRSVSIQPDIADNRSSLEESAETQMQALFPGEQLKFIWL